MRSSESRSADSGEAGGSRRRAPRTQRRGGRTQAPAARRRSPAARGSRDRRCRSTTLLDARAFQSRRRITSTAIVTACWSRSQPDTARRSRSWSSDRCPGTRRRWEDARAADRSRGALLRQESCGPAAADRRRSAGRHQACGPRHTTARSARCSRRRSHVTSCCRSLRSGPTSSITRSRSSTCCCRCPSSASGASRQRWCGTPGSAPLRTSGSSCRRCCRGLVDPLDRPAV